MLANQFSFPGMQQMPIKATNSTQKLPQNSIKIPENTNIFPSSSIQSMSSNSLHQSQQTDLIALKQENQALKQKLEYVQNLIDNTKQFENSKNIVDVKAFLKKNSQTFSDLVDELYQEKRQQSKENVPPSMTSNANQNFYLSKIKELEEKNDSNLKELTQLRESNKKLKDDVAKKDFFREYDFMIKEVEGLRKQNMNLSETIKKLQTK